MSEKLARPPDSSSKRTDNPQTCGRCGATTRLGERICLSCLLHEGLENEGEPSEEVFAKVLEEAEVPDRQWRLGNYEILEEIGRGGMGVIYRARQRQSRRIVALKRVLSYHADSHEALVRFRREAEAAAQLDHPNILPIYEVGESEDGLPFFSMKFATGGSLRAAAPTLRDRPNECVRLIAKVARAIEYAHGQGILHRDLQPGNILLDSHGEAMVSDFGLAKWLAQNSDLTQSLTTFGTPGYIAPEQAESATGELTPAADVYSLGAVLFNLLAHRPPFVGENVLSVIRQAGANPAPKLRSVAPSLDRDLETICARCLERDPKARYQSAADLAEDLERWLEGRPIRARPVPIPARAWRWSRRNPVLAGAALVCFSLGGAVLWLLSEQHGRPQLPPPEKSIAVLPFQNLSQDKENAFFAEGVQDEILTNLAKVADLKVISRTSVMQYKDPAPRNLREIAQQLGVANLLEGSVQRTRDRVRVNAQLIDARDDTHLWAQSYDGDLKDVFAIQSQIARTIAEQLRAKLSAGAKAAIAQAPTNDLVANELYQKAIALEAQEGGNLLEAIKLLEQAVGRDPQFVRAHNALARLHVFLYESADHTPSRLRAAEASIEDASQIQPDAGEVHLVRARYFSRALHDYDRARAELALARRSLPNDPSVYEEAALLDRRQGRWAEAQQNYANAIELDPRNRSILENGAFTCSQVRRYAEAIRLAQRVLVLDPADDWARIFIAAQALHERAEPARWRTELDTVLARNRGAGSDYAADLFECALAQRDAAAGERALALIPPAGLPFYFGCIAPREWYTGYLARVFNHPEAARTAFLAAKAILEKQVRERPESGLSWSMLGVTKAALGEKEEAIAAGRRACDLWPVAKEPFWGPTTRRCLAAIYAWVGDKDQALEQLAAYLDQPSFIDYGGLKLDPAWDPLRGDPRFEALVARMAPDASKTTVSAIPEAALPRPQ